MKTENEEKILMPRLFSQENKVIKMKEILSCIITQQNSLLSARDTDILRLILIENKDIKEVAEKFGLTSTTIKHLFNRAMKRAVVRYSDFQSIKQTADDLYKEVRFLTKKLKEYESKEMKRLNITTQVRDLLHTEVEKFDFSARLLNQFKAADIITVADLMKFSKKDLLRFRGVGKNSIKEIDTFFNEHKLSWGMEL